MILLYTANVNQDNINKIDINILLYPLIFQLIKC